jgi:hypothetical protein
LAAAAGLLDLNLELAGRRAMSWLIRYALVARGNDGFGVAEDGIIKLGANALAVLALLSMRDFCGQDMEIVAGLADYMWKQQVDNGDFLHKRSVATGAGQPFRSLYYTGEALFALLLASERLNKPDQFRRATTTLKTLIGCGYGFEQHSHWMMYAVEAHYRTAPDSMLQAYAEQMVDEILKQPYYRERQCCTPIACRTEALLAYLRMSRVVIDWQHQRLFRVQHAVEQNLALQLRDRLPDGAFRKGADSNEVRIDYLQHNLLTLLQYSTVHGGEA